MSTPHNSAKEGMIAKTVLMPGDPLRAKFIAENYLENVEQFNSVRNMFGFTGDYKGTRVSVMGSGMGMPSIGIYSYELFKFYDVENIIRIGSAGAYTKELNLFDVVLVTGSYSESSFAKTQNGYDKDITYPSKELNDKLIKASKDLNIELHPSLIHSSDVFYREPDPNFLDEIVKKGCKCVEMESFALFHNASVLNKHAACLLTISDSLVDSKQTTAEERQTSFTKMMEVALQSIKY